MHWLLDWLTHPILVSSNCTFNKYPSSEYGTYLLEPLWGWVSLRTASCLIEILMVFNILMVSVAIFFCSLAISDYKQSLQFQSLNEEKHNIRVEVCVLLTT